MCQKKKRIRKVRPDLRIIISSATIEAQLFVDYFNDEEGGGGFEQRKHSSAQPDDPTGRGGPPPRKKSRWDIEPRAAAAATMVRLEGKAYPVEICYLESPTNDVVLTAVETVFDIHLKVREAPQNSAFSTPSSAKTDLAKNCTTAPARRHSGVPDGTRRDRSMSANDFRLLAQVILFL